MLPASNHVVFIRGVSHCGLHQEFGGLHVSLTMVPRNIRHDVVVSIHIFDPMMNHTAQLCYVANSQNIHPQYLFFTASLTDTMSKGQDY